MRFDEARSLLGKRYARDASPRYAVVLTPAERLLGRVNSFLMIRATEKGALEIVGPPLAER
jgi:hypothetical protein